MSTFKKNSMFTNLCSFRNLPNENFFSNYAKLISKELLKRHKNTGKLGIVFFVMPIDGNFSSSKLSKKFPG